MVLLRGPCAAFFRWQSAAPFSQATAFTFEAFCYMLAGAAAHLHVHLLRHLFIALDELKTDYKNPIDQCNTLNPFVLPDYLSHAYILFFFFHAFFCVLFLYVAEWFTLGVNMPLLAYHIWKYMSRPVMSGPGLYDPTTIMNTDILAYCQKKGWCKLAFYLLAFFFLLPIWHDLCFGELLEQHSEELVQLSACKKPPTNGFYPARSYFQEWPMESDQLL